MPFRLLIPHLLYKAFITRRKQKEAEQEAEAQLQLADFMNKVK
jgi:hypothetical protein